MLAVKKRSTAFAVLNCLKMDLFFSGDVDDDSQRSGRPKACAPDHLTAQTSVSPQHPVVLHWLEPSEVPALTCRLLSVKRRKTTLLGLGHWGAPRAVLESSLLRSLAQFSLTSAVARWPTASETKPESPELCRSVPAATPGYV